MKFLTVGRLSSFAFMMNAVLFSGIFFSGCQTAQPTNEASRTVASSKTGISRKGLDFLKTKSSQELAVIFAGGTDDPIPNGNSEGLPIILADSPKLDWVGNQVWDGKRFARSPDGSAHLVNNLAENKLDAIAANVYKGQLSTAIGSHAATMESFYPWDKSTYDIDGNESILLDYHHTKPEILRGIVDELRHIYPDQYGGGLYLGRATLYGKFVCYFALEFDQETPDTN